MNSTDVQENLRDNYLSPLNYGKPEWQADHIISVENPTCGDSLTLYVKLNEGIVEEIAFTAEGCSIAIATASMLYERVKGKMLTERLIEEDELFELLGFTPTTSRKNCALLSLDALKKIS